MLYSHYSNLAILKERLGIQHQTKNWLKNIAFPTETPSDHLKADIELAYHLPLSNEKARSESIISPILREVFRKNKAKISFFSGYGFAVDDTKGLTGNCDYLFAARPALVEVEQPVFCLVEAKKGIIEEGYAQCAAEMYAAKLYNEQVGEQTDIIYGAVSNGHEWVFLKLENDTILIDNQRFYIKELPAILGILQWIVEQF